MRVKKDPIVFYFDETNGLFSNLKSRIEKDLKEDSDLLLNFPTVYIHNWKKIEGNNEGLYDVYIGESNNVIERTKEHYTASKNPNNWQYHLLNNSLTSNMYIIGHKHFNKSLTLDVENRLIHYISSMQSVNTVHNSRGNPQNKYYLVNELDDIFKKIWAKLREMNQNLFLTEAEIKASAIFKASPLHKLTAEQIEAKNTIINKAFDAINNNKTGQLIFVNGEAGTGKTVLNSSTFYDLLDLGNGELKCCLIVNHDEQINVYKEIVRRLGLAEKYGKSIVSKPTAFINNHSSTNPIDISFVDEAHLLLTQGKQSYRGKNQLQDIIERSRVTVIMFDENQIMTTESFWEDKLIKHFIKLSSLQKNYITLNKQLRMKCAKSTLDWIDNLTKNHIVNSFIKDSTGYEVKIFDKPEELHKAIKNKASKDSSKLSRIVASYDWEYRSNNRPTGKPYWSVSIKDWSLPWNRELQNDLSIKEKRKNKTLSWAEQTQTINECGSIFTIQGFDLSYVGVIIGPSVKYENGKIVFHPECSFNKKVTRMRTLSNGSQQKFGEKFIQNELRVLLTRGVNGLYIYADDDALRVKLKEVIG